MKIMNNNYKKLISKINTLEKNKSKKEEKIKELQSSLNEDNKELKRLYSFKEAFDKTSNELDQYLSDAGEY
jgi:chromosome segregation ATPase